MRKLRCGLLAALVVVSGAACGDPGDGERGIDALLTAADAVEDAGSSRVEGTMSFEGGGQSMEITFDGVFDYDAKIGEMTMTIDAGDAGAGVPGLGGPIEMIVDDQYVYMKGGAIDPLLQGKEWGRMDMEAAGTNAGQFNQDPTQFVEWLRGAGDVEEVGEDEIRGTATTHYRTKLTVDDIIENAPDEETADRLRDQLEALGGEIESMPLDVWLDDAGLPRRLDVEIGVSGGGAAFNSVISMDMFDYGAEVDVEPPSDFEDISSPAG